MHNFGLECLKRNGCNAKNCYLKLLALVLQIKADPGIRWFTTGFTLLMLGVMSYVSHSQVWAPAKGWSFLPLGGRTIGRKHSGIK